MIHDDWKSKNNNNNNNLLEEWNNNCHCLCHKINTEHKNKINKQKESNR